MCHIGTWSTKYCMRTKEKVWGRKKKNKNGLPSVSVWRSAKEPLCRVLGRLALGKEFFKKN